MFQESADHQQVHGSKSNKSGTRTPAAEIKIGALGKEKKKISLMFYILDNTVSLVRIS